MAAGSGNGGVRWPEFVTEPTRQRESVRAAVCAVVLEDGGPCFGVTLDQRWLCGSGGELTFFDSMAAASRFLQLMKVPGVSYGAPRAVGHQARDRAQCFRLTRNGLVACAKCSVGQRAHARAAVEELDQDDDW